MVQISISQRTSNANFGVNNQCLLQKWQNKRFELDNDIYTVFDQNNRFWRNNGLLKISLFQCYEKLLFIQLMVSVGRFIKTLILSDTTISLRRSAHKIWIQWNVQNNDFERIISQEIFFLNLPLSNDFKEDWRSLSVLFIMI